MPRPAPARDMRTTLLLCGAGIAAAALAVYARGLGGLFLYDDVDSIVGNASIRHLSAALLPPAGLTVSGRPVLNLSFAINYRSEEHTSELQSLRHLVCRLLLEKKEKT